MQRLSFDHELVDNGTADGQKQRSAAMQLAIDEAMLVWAETAFDPVMEPTLDTETIRFWRFDRPTVVLGRSSRITDEVNLEWCAAHGVEVLRRCTGGASVVGGPGCLMYSMVLKIGDARNLRKIDLAHDHVMSHVLSAVRCQFPETERRGICDLTIGEKKFSGNSLRVMRHHLLYHGTILIDSDLQQIANCLAFAPRQPEYRGGRDHREFVTNLNLRADLFCSDLAKGMKAMPAQKFMRESIDLLALDLVRQRYGCPSWHRRH